MCRSEQRAGSIAQGCRKAGLAQKHVADWCGKWKPDMGPWLGPAKGMFAPFLAGEQAASKDMHARN